MLEDLTFARNTSLSGQSVQECKLRMMAQEAALKEVANGEPRRLLARIKSFSCTDVKVGGSSPVQNCGQEWRAPAEGPGVDSGH